MEENTENHLVAEFSAAQDEPLCRKTAAETYLRTLKANVPEMQERELEAFLLRDETAGEGQRRFRMAFYSTFHGIPYLIGQNFRLEATGEKAEELLPPVPGQCDAGRAAGKSDRREPLRPKESRRGCGRSSVAGISGDPANFRTVGQRRLRLFAGGAAVRLHGYDRPGTEKRGICAAPGVGGEGNHPRLAEYALLPAGRPGISGVYGIWEPYGVRGERSDRRKYDFVNDDRENRRYVTELLTWEKVQP